MVCHRHLTSEWHTTPQHNVLHARRQCALGYRHQHLRKIQVRAETQTPSLLQKLGRVLREKTVGDIDRVFKGTSKTREKLGVVEELLAYWKLEDADDLLEELEEVLISSDFGPKTALKIVDSIRDEVKAGRIQKPEEIRAKLKQVIISVLQPPGSTSELKMTGSKVCTILVVGVNGGGKTTSVGKLAHKLVQQGAKVMLVAADTFRAAAADQLEGWAGRSGASIERPTNPSQTPAAVITQALTRAIREETDVVICDTSGRLHTNWRLMEELADSHKAIKDKVKRVNEVLLVLDGTTGLNMANQAREFNETVPLTGLVLTKLDGSARGGAVVGVVDELKIPIKFVGVGETVEDLQPFDATSFVEGLFPEIV